MDRSRLALVLGVATAADAVACAIPVAFIKEALDRVGCPPALQRALPVVKATAATGLLVGTRHPGVRRLTATALVAYFATAVGFHVKAGEPAQGIPAGALGLASAVIATR